MTERDLSQQFKAKYDEWDAAVARKDHSWMERHLADDFLGTAQPWPTLAITRPMLLSAAHTVKEMKVKWIEVTAQRFGEIVFTTSIRQYENEEFEEGAPTFGDDQPTGNQLAELVKGKRVLYIGAWREEPGVWKLFDHHLVGIIGDSEL